MTENEILMQSGDEDIAVEVDGDIVVPADAPDGGDNSWTDSGLNEEGGDDE